VACRLKARISESQRTSVARQRLGNHGSFTIAGELTRSRGNAYIIDRYHGNESPNSGASEVTNPLVVVASELRKLKV
jgi:hypothetical protein